MFGDNWLKVKVTLTGLVPKPADCAGVVLNVARLLLLPHSNHAEAGLPLGFTVPDSVAPPPLTPVAGKVVAVGGAVGEEVNATAKVRFQLLVPEVRSGPRVCVALGEML